MRDKSKYNRTIEELSIMLKVIRKKYERKGVRFDGLKRQSCKECNGLGYKLIVRED